MIEGAVLTKEERKVVKCKYHRKKLFQIGVCFVIGFMIFVMMSCYSLVVFQLVLCSF